ncbi:MAG: helix-turn-helix transcriptional regulator [Candidatus Heimdallarchaeota archaeon]
MLKKNTGKIVTILIVVIFLASLFSFKPKNQIECQLSNNEITTEEAFTLPFVTTIIQNTISPLQETNYDISVGKITSYLHTKTAQIQLDIEFVGAEEASSLQSTNIETIEVAGFVRSVQVIESDSKILPYTTTELENSTKIQFTLSSNIPVGYTRNVKITFVQDTEELSTKYNYKLGIDWLRRVGTQTTKIIFDKGLALIKCTPNPHTISTIGKRLILSWLEVNKFLFYSNINFTSPLIIEELDISPTGWNVGEIRRNSKYIERIFEITNNENIPLSGTIETPNWIETNFTSWNLGIGRAMYLKAVINTSTAGSISGNISILFSIDAFPIEITVTGQINKVSNLAIILSTTIPSLFLVGIGSTLFILFKKDKWLFSKKDDTVSTEEPDDDTKIAIRQIDMEKWKEILTEKEYLVFQQILDGKELTQAAICRRTTLSKSTISRCVGRLQAKGLVKKIPYGMSNLISLNDELFTNDK